MINFGELYVALLDRDDECWREPNVATKDGGSQNPGPLDFSYNVKKTTYSSSSI